MKITLSSLCFIVFIQACSSVSSVDRPSDYWQSKASQEENSLIDASAMGDDDGKIRELLDYRFKLPSKNRIAILKLNSDNDWRYYSDDFVQLNDALIQSFITTLRNSDRVYDASFLPSMLIPGKSNIPVLREAAARFQADMLLAYRSSCQSYQKYKMFDADQNKSTCSVEAVLLDVRSGLIVKSVVSSKDFLAAKTGNDTNFNETIKKAELEATTKALGNIANEIVTFLNRAPALNP